VVATVFRPHPTEDVRGRKVALFTTAPEEVHDRMAESLAEEHGAEVIAVSGNLSKRTRLREELEDGRLAEADAFVTEIKAAAIDVVAAAAEERGVELVFCDNRPQPVDGEDLDGRLVDLAHAAVRSHVRA
jgi:cyclic 2,3-diphosphoglycerate synthetase